MKGKTCTKCGEWKVFGEFAKCNRDKKRGGLGYQSKCKACNKEYRKTNAEQVNASIKKAKEKNSEHYKNLHKIYWEENKEHINKARNERYKIDGKYRSREKKRSKEWYDNNPEKAYETNKQYRASRREQYNKYNVKYRQTEKGRVTGYKHVLKRLSYKHKVIFKPHERKAILDRDNWTCCNCGIKVHDRSTGDWNTPDKAHIDHIIPLSKSGNSEPNNLQTLCRTCNLSKGDKIEAQI